MTGLDWGRVPVTPASSGYIPGRVPRAAVNPYRVAWGAWRLVRLAIITTLITIPTMVMLSAPWFWWTLTDGLAYVPMGSEDFVVFAAMGTVLGLGAGWTLLCAYAENIIDAYRAFWHEFERRAFPAGPVVPAVPAGDMSSDAGPGPP